MKPIMKEPVKQPVPEQARHAEKSAPKIVGVGSPNMDIVMESVRASEWTYAGSTSPTASGRPCSRTA